MKLVPNSDENLTKKHPTKSGIFLALRRISGLLILIAIFLLLGQFAKQDSNQSIPPPNSALIGSQAPEPKPMKIQIAKIGVDAPVVDLGLKIDGTLSVPKKDEDVGWYTGSPSPGGVGPAIMVGHLDSVRGAAVFYQLKNLQPGDEFSVMRKDGSVAVFRVDTSEQYSQDHFPTEKVYGPIDYPGIRLITCAGTYRRFVGHYSDNLVVYGTLVKINPAT